jgi:uncharacterized membrane protein
MQIISDYESKLDDLINKGYRVKIEDYIRKGVDIFRKAPELFILYTILYIIVMPLGGVFFTGPLTAGFIIVSAKLENNEKVVFEDFLEGFRLFIPLFLVAIVTSIVVFFGYLLFIIPGIYLSVCYIFAIHFVIFEKLDFWEAMEASRKLVSREWFSIFGLVIVLAVLNFLGVLFCGVGIIVTIPISISAIYAAFKDIYLDYA